MGKKDITLSTLLTNVILPPSPLDNSQYEKCKTNGRWKFSLNEDGDSNHLFVEICDTTNDTHSKNLAFFASYFTCATPIPVKIPKIPGPKDPKIVFTPTMNGCILYIISVLNYPNDYLVYHLPREIGKPGCKEFHDESGNIIPMDNIEIVEKFGWEQYCPAGAEESNFKKDDKSFPDRYMTKWSSDDIKELEKLSITDHQVGMYFGAAVFLIFLNEKWTILSQWYDRTGIDPAHKDARNLRGKKRYAKMRSIFITAVGSSTSLRTSTLLDSISRCSLIFQKTFFMIRLSNGYFATIAMILLH